MYLRCYTEKIGQLELSEPKNLCYTSTNFTVWNYFPQKPVVYLPNVNICLVQASDTSVQGPAEGHEENLKKYLV